jgi:hypothetical protein
LAKDVLPAGSIVAKIEVICRRTEPLERLGNLMAGFPGINTTDQQIALRLRGSPLPEGVRYRFPAEAPEHVDATDKAHGLVRANIAMGERLTDDVHFGHRIGIHDSDGETWLAPGAQGLLQEWELEQDRAAAPACANEQDA